jgi:hypothetical protein
MIRKIDLQLYIYIYIYPIPLQPTNISNFEAQKYESPRPKEYSAARCEAELITEQRIVTLEGEDKRFSEKPNYMGQNVS